MPKIAKAKGPKSPTDVSVAAVVKDAVVKDAVVKDAVVKDAVVKEAVVKDAVVKEAVVKDAVVKDAVVKDAVVKEKAAAKAPRAVLTHVAPSTKKVPAIDANDPFEGMDELSDADFLAQQRTLLWSERETYSNQAEMLRAEADQLAIDMEPGDVQFDDESGEGAGTSVERERDLAMSAQALQTVVEIDRALARMDARVYGVCDNCNTWIMRARLRAMPYATLCIACKNGGLSRR